MNFLRVSLWIAPHLLVAFCLVGLILHGLYRQFRIFFIYLVLQEVEFTFSFGTFLLMRLAASHPTTLLATYQWNVVLDVAINSSFQIAVLYEVADKLMLRQSRIAEGLRLIMQWAIALLVVLSVGIGAAFSESGIKRVIHAFEVLNFSANLVNVGVLIVLVLFTRVFQISWKSLPAGIVLGFGIYSSGEMGATGLISAMGGHGIVAADIVRMLTFLVATLTWLIYVFFPGGELRFTGQAVQKSEIEAWSNELQKMAER